MEIVLPTIGSTVAIKNTNLSFGWLTMYPILKKPNLDPAVRKIYILNPFLILVLLRIYCIL